MGVDVFDAAVAPTERGLPEGQQLAFLIDGQRGT